MFRSRSTKQAGANASPSPKDKEASLGKPPLPVKPAKPQRLMAPAGKTMQQEIDELKQEKAQLEIALESQRALVYDLQTRLDGMSLGKGLAVLDEARRTSNMSLNGVMEVNAEDLPYDPDDELAQAQAEIAAKTFAGGGHMSTASSASGRGTLTKQKSIVSARRLSNMNSGVLKRHAPEISSRNVDHIAKMLNEHLTKKQTEYKHEPVLADDPTLSSRDLTPPMPASHKKGPPPKLIMTEQLIPKESEQPVAAYMHATSSNNLTAMEQNKTGRITDPGTAGSHQSTRALHTRTPSFLRKVLAHKSVRVGGPRTDLVELSGMVNLPRGGVYLTTSAGPIQFGAPPETIKDSMELGMPVPSIFVVPPERFNLHEGINVAEIEFPAFFNFFVLRKKVRLVTYPDTVSELRAIMQEALLGPEKQYLMIDSEYSKFVSPDMYAARANHVKEMEYFYTPRAPDFYKINIDELIQFEFFDSNGFVDLGNGVTIKDDHKDGFEVYDAGNDPRKRMGSKNFSDEAKGPDLSDTSITAEGGSTPPKMVPPSETYVPYDKASSCLSVPPSMSKNNESITQLQEQQASFIIPQFGVTVLGNSHGFDPEGSTSGFVVWVNGQGIMVDPPPHSTVLLMKAGIQPKSVTALILTHCHADHEVGTIQKMIKEDKVVLLTTRTIMDSFLRKYEAVTGLGAEFLAQLVTFRPVYLEEPTYWNGASFRFFYSLHSIPCMGFEVTFEDKRIVYSADTYYDPDGLQAMYKSGVLSEARLQALMNFPWDCDVVLHEMGVPPIHTPLEALEKLPEKYRKNIYLIHIGAKTARDAKKRGFKIATPGVENTITLIRAPEQDDNSMLKFFQLISSMDIFRGFSLAQALELWFMAKSKNYSVGANIVEEGTPGDTFYIIAKGSASVTVGGNKKVFRSGDFLGEVSVVTGAVRTATVVADTQVITFEVDRYSFDYLVMHDPRLRIRMENLIKARSDGSWMSIAQNSLLSQFTSSQKTQLQALLTVRALRKGDLVWQKGEAVRIGVLISKGGLRFLEVHGPLGEAYEDGSPLTPGMFIFDMLGCMNHFPLTTTLIADSDVTLVFTFEAEAMMQYLEANPLLLLGLLKSVVII